MSLIQDFKQFVMRGNVLDLATAVIIGGAFGKIVSSFVADVIMPPIGLVMGKVDFKDLKIVLQAANGEAMPEVAIRYGLFLQNIFDFVIVAFCIFLVIQAYNVSKKKEVETPQPPAPPEPSNEEKLLAEIRDLLKKQQ